MRIDFEKSIRILYLVLLDNLLLFMKNANAVLYLGKDLVSLLLVLGD